MGLGVLWDNGVDLIRGFFSAFWFGWMIALPGRGFGAVPRLRVVYFMSILGLLG